MSNVLTDVVSLLEDPYSRARQEKAKGRKVIGVTPMHFPEELVHAGGALPVILQESNEPVTEGYGHIYPYFCGFSRSNVDTGVKGKLDFFDAIVISDVCLQTRHMCHILRLNMKRTPFIFMQWPMDSDADRFMSLAIDRLQRCQTKLEDLLGIKIEDSAIRKSIQLHNRMRGLLRRVYEIRKAKPGIISAREFSALVASCMVLPKEEQCQVLETLVPALEKKAPPADKRVKVFLSGHLCHAVKPDISDLIERMGGIAVGDDLYAGYRYIATDVPTGGPPLEALARLYFDQAVPCPTQMDTGRRWGDYLVRAIRDSGAQGIIHLRVKFCESHLLSYPHINESLTEAGIPQLLVDTEHEMVSLEGLKTRVQAFMEMLQSKGG